MAGGLSDRSVPVDDRHVHERRAPAGGVLYDNQEDPFQMRNLAGKTEHAGLQRRMDALLEREMSRRGDALLPARHYLDRYGYEVDESGAVPYETSVPQAFRR